MRTKFTDNMSLAQKLKLKKYMIIRVFAMDYHSGQWSRGYRLLSLTSKLELTDEFIRLARGYKLYKHLVANYKDKM